MTARMWKLARKAVPGFFTMIYRTTGRGYWLAAYFASRWLTRATHFRPTFTPCKYGLSFQTVQCRTSDNITLKGWEISPLDPVGTVALFHGLRKNREHVFERCQVLVEAGFRCVAFDHRAHGESGGRVSSFGYYEGRDVEAVLDFIKATWPDQPRGVLGISMGAAAACFAAEKTRHCQAVVLESCYRDVFTAFSNRLHHRYPDWMRRLSPGTVSVSERRLGITAADVNPGLHIDKLAPAPVLLLTGTKDMFAPPEEAQMLYERCAGPREIWLVPDADHHDVLEVAGDSYRDVVVDFLRRHLDSSSSGTRAA